MLEFSRAGDKILFESVSGGVCSVNADGEGFLTLTHDEPGAYKSAHWSPSGDAIAFSSRRNGDVQIFLLTIHDLSVYQVTKSPGGNALLAWAPQ
jgi:Tol biopolymer transport system component